MKHICLFTLLFFLLAPQSAIAEQLIGSYTARISERDHYNSYGERLKSAAAIIRQDRANFHRFGRRDDEDESDSFFANKRNRALMERWLRHGYMSQKARNRILWGRPIITVRIYGYGRTGEYIKVTID